MRKSDFDPKNVQVGQARLFVNLDIMGGCDDIKSPLFQPFKLN
jgi:hypothetical protein